ncbi:nuclear pore complex protein Nup153 isoform X2 [Orussus abietinus]|uniref:nuclear pore complex protein Nup153 isoform X2 n=1 Tax=Orussus abietinus TaxID=222816 RepID=UPI000626BB77|nr:nuclear pore complex protein Nup153 isoform X2 [Orussus abietinus]
MAKGSNNLTGRRSHGPKPYDANNVSSRVLAERRRVRSAADPASLPTVLRAFPRMDGLESRHRPDPSRSRPRMRQDEPGDVRAGRPSDSFVKKVATKVTDFIPQRSWISKWFNTSQDNGDVSSAADNTEESEQEEEAVQRPPPTKRPRIRMDVTHPPGTFSIQPRNRIGPNNEDSLGERFHHNSGENFLEPMIAGPSGTNRLVSSTPAIRTDTRSENAQRTELNSLVSSQNNGAANGTDDNSESSESTSGCSSLIPQTNRQEAPVNAGYNKSFVSRKRYIDDKMTFTNHLQSPRSLFLDSSNRDSLSSRRPSFDASMMNATMDRASPLSSPFYSGNTTFGGANAAGLYKRNRTLFNNTSEISLKLPRRTSVQVKPSNASGIDSCGMSQTAKRILEALEHFSSPVSDAKKIPVKSTKNTSSPAAGATRSKDEITPSARVGLRHLARELVVPTVPDLLKLRRRQKIQDTTVAARKIISANSGPPPNPEEYRLRSDDDESSKFQGKLKKKSNTNIEQEDTVETVNLPSVSLPISSLPNFDIALPVPSSRVEAHREEPSGDTFQFASPIRVTSSSSNLKSINNFTFSKPLTVENKEGVNDSNDSNNLSKTMSMDSNSSISFPLGPNFVWTGSFAAPKLKEKKKREESSESSFVGAKVASELKTGSVMDILGGKQSSTPASKSSAVDVESEHTLITSSTPMGGTGASEKQGATSSEMWECSQCLIRNSNSQLQCIACKTAKSDSKSKASNPDSKSTVSQSSSTINDNSMEHKTSKASSGFGSFGAQFKMSNDLWECTSCLVRNKQADAKCVACGVANSKKQQDSTPSKNMKPVDSSPTGKLKSVDGSWDCPGCTLKNTSIIAACPCCNTPKPSSAITSLDKGNVTFGSDLGAQGASKPLTTSSEGSEFSSMLKAKYSEGSWECPSCLARNENFHSACPCCDTAKPGGPASKKTESTSTAGFGDKFKKPEGSWSCDSCMVQNKGDVMECIACGGTKPGTQKPKTTSTSSTGSTLTFNFGVPSDAGQFKFGIDKAEKPATNSTASGFTFGVQNAQSSPAGGFSFGVPKDSGTPVTASETTSSTASVSAFVPKAAESEPAFKFGTPIKTGGPVEKVGTPMFSFTVPKTEPPKSSTSSKTSGEAPFSFGAPTTLSSGAPTFSFGVPKSTVAQKEGAKDLPQAGTFGVASAEPAKTSTPAGESSLSATASVALPSATGKPGPADSKPPSSQTPAFSFGAPSTSTPTTTATSLPSQPGQSGFSFEPKTTSIGQTPAIPGFGRQSMTPSTSFSFGVAKPTVEASTTEKKPVASFGGANAPPATFNSPPASSLFGGTTSKSASTFGSTEPSPMFSIAEGKTPTFGAVDTKIGPIFGSTENKTPSFGSTEKPSFGAAEKSSFGAAEKPPSVFGSPASTFGATPANPAPTFGSSTGPVFGGPTATATPFGTDASSSIFSGTKASESATPAPSTGLFGFGSSGSSQTSIQSPGGFGFAGTSSATGPAATPKPLFSFSGTSTAPQTGNAFGTAGSFGIPSSGAFTFNAPKPEAPAFGQNPATAAPSLFGAQSPTPLGQTQPVPSFGQSGGATGAPFSFGSTAPSTGTTGGFNFAATNPTPAAPGGFNFSATNPTSTVSFDPNTKPSFNFTQGSAPTAFNATPQPAVPRKIKKAVRRMPPR